MFVVPQIPMMKLATLIKTGLLDTGTIDLFQNDAFLSPATVLADLDVADFSGYAQGVLTLWLAPLIESDGSVVLVGPQIAFAHSGGIVANVIFGYSISDTDGDFLLAEKFPDPIPMAALGNTILVTARFPLQLAA